MPKATSPAGSRNSARTSSGRASKAQGFSRYEDALEFLHNRPNFERSRPVKGNEFKLDRTRALLRELGDPQHGVKSVHIAGSKGKGSAVEMTASMLAACGYAVGVFTSPHLVDVRERIRINEHPISREDFRALMGPVARACEAVKKREGEATFFEVMTALGLSYFAEQAVDIAVIEVGLGGRLDSTNVITPEVAAITEIQLEHTQILGDTLAKIAREKAGILKPGVPALTVAQKPEVIDVFREVAASVVCPLKVLGKDVDYSCRFESSPELGPHARVSVVTRRSNYEHMPVPLKGEHQAKNCGLALAILDTLRERGFDCPEREVAVGLARTPSAGRMERAWDRPIIILDGAHTPESVECLIKALGAHMRYDSMVMVFGCSNDKNIDGMLAKVALGADKIIFTRAAGSPRATDPAELQRRFGEGGGKMTQVAQTLEQAFNSAARAVGRDDIIVVTGSFFLVGEAKRYLRDLAASRRKA